MMGLPPEGWEVFGGVGGIPIPSDRGGTSWDGLRHSGSLSEWHSPAHGCLRICQREAGPALLSWKEPVLGPQG